MLRDLDLDRRVAEFQAFAALGDDDLLLRRTKFLRDLGGERCADHRRTGLSRKPAVSRCRSPTAGCHAGFVIPAIRLDAESERGVVTSAIAKKLKHEVQERGYARADALAHADFTSLAAPVFDHDAVQSRCSACPPISRPARRAAWARYF
jgi:hypothetical protein